MFFLLTRQLFDVDGRHHRPTPGVISVIDAGYTRDIYRTLEAGLDSLLRDLRHLEPNGIGPCDSAGLQLTLRDGGTVVTARYRSRYAPIMGRLSDFVRRVAAIGIEERVAQAMFGPDYPCSPAARAEPLRGALIAATGETDPERTARLLELDDIEFMAIMSLGLQGYDLEPLLAAG